MGWFDEQIKQRRENDDRQFEESFVRIADAVLGSRMSAAFAGDDEKTRGEIGEILKYYGLKARPIPESVKGLDDQLEYLLRPNGEMRRNIRLEKGWYKDAAGAMLARRRDDGSVAALIPRGLGGYVYHDAASGKWVKVTKANEDLFETDAICFYKPFPLGRLTPSMLLRYIISCLDRADMILMLLAALAAALTGLLLPRLTGLLFGSVAESGELRLLLSLAVFMISVSLSQLLFQSISTLMTARINTKLSVSVQAATMMRILSLPAEFFKNHSSGELASRFMQVEKLVAELVPVILNTGLTALFSLLYVTQIFTFAPVLAAPAIAVVGVMLLVSVATALCQMKIGRKQKELAAQESGMSYALISGIQKIRLSGAEKRAYARWSDLYAKVVAITYNPPLFLKLNTVISMAISLAGTLMIYGMALRSDVNVSDYYAFNAAYGMLSGAFAMLAGFAMSAAEIGPVLTMAKPLMDTEPEISPDKPVIDKITGAIEVSNVSFRYQDDMPLVLDDLSLKIRPGQYVAIVGATGCGKSTLLRILLGFEKPQKGAVYYNGRDLNTIDLKSLRHKIGVVLQDSRLFQGDIFSNIVISAPHLTLQDAWEAAEMAGVAEDIRQMPMGMHTVVSEGGGGSSGGQRQRLMIARAIAPKPKVLMFDEATSALDNVAQKQVSDSLEKLKCTRIVIAHRLSTIRACDRIIYLEKGRIVEDGTYEELIALNGRFARLVQRQRLDV